MYPVTVLMHTKDLISEKVDIWADEAELQGLRRTTNHPMSNPAVLRPTSLLQTSSSPQGA